MVISGVNTVTYNGNGITTAWPYTFPVTDDSEIRVQLNNADGTAVIIESDYYVDLVNSTVYYPGYAPGAEPPESEQPAKVQTGQTITIYREIPMTQEADLGEKWPFEVIEKGLDKLTMIAQQIASGTKRTLDDSLASMFQLAGIVTDTGKLQHITEQYNAMDVNAERAEIAAASAVGSATSAAGSAVSAADSAAAAAKIVDVGVDPTLTVPDAAADSAAVGDIVDNPFTRRIRLNYMPQKNIRYIDTDYVTWADGSYRTFASEMTPIPEGGIGIGINPKYDSGWGGRVFDVRFFKKSGADYVPATSYNAAYSTTYYTNTNRLYALSYYAPYAEGVYFTVILAVPIAEAPTDPLDFVEVFAKCKGQKTADKVPYLFPVSAAARTYDNLNCSGYGMYGSGADRHLYRGSFCQYGFIIPVKYIKRVSCNPEYGLAVQIYNISNGSLQFASGKVGASFNLATYGNLDQLIIGTGEIDLSGVNDGIALFIIAKRALIKTNSDNTLGVQARDLGGLVGYHDIAANVFVELKQGCKMEGNCLGSSTFTGNVEVYEKYMVQDNNTMEYGNSIYDTHSATPWDISPRGSFSGFQYTGYNMFWNVPIKHVTPKSLATASQNPNSRFNCRYVSPDYTNIQAGRCAYGTHCLQTATVLQGIIESYWEDGATFTSNWGNKFDMLPFDYKKDINSLQAGDILFSKYGGSGLSVHMVVVLDVIKVNNEILAVSYIEGYPPFDRHSAAINVDYFIDNIGDNIINSSSGIRSLKYLANYTELRRIKPQYQRKLIANRTFPALAPSVGKIMCDRGTDSIYGLDNDNIYLSIDSSVSTVYYDVTKDGSITHNSFSVGSFTPTSRSTVDLIEIDIKSIVTTDGYYEFYSVLNGAVEESFFVPARQTISCDLTTGECSISNLQDAYALYIQHTNDRGYFYTMPIESKTPAITPGAVADYTGVPRASTTSVYTPDMMEMFFFDSISVSGMPALTMNARCYDKDYNYLGKYDFVGTVVVADLIARYPDARYMRIVFDEADPDNVAENLVIARPASFSILDWDSNGIFHTNSSGDFVLDRNNKIPHRIFIAYDTPYGAYWQANDGVCASCDPSEAGH